MPTTWRDGHPGGHPGGHRDEHRGTGRARPGAASWLPRGHLEPRAWATVVVVTGVMILVALGAVQLKLGGDHDRLLARAHARMAVPAVPLPAAIDDPAAFDGRRVTVTGRLLNDRELYLVARSRYGNLGLEVVTPLVRDDGGGIVLINRGWVPTERRSPGTRARGQPPGIVTIAGVARLPPGRDWFQPDNRPAENAWYFLDLPAMARAAGIARPAPLLVEAGSAYNPGGLPVGGQSSLDLANDHLRYALLWFGLAAALVVVYTVAYWRRDPVGR